MSNRHIRHGWVGTERNGEEIDCEKQGGLQWAGRLFFSYSLPTTKQLPVPRMLQHKGSLYEKEVTGLGDNNAVNRADKMVPNVIINPLNPELNPICYLLALLAHHLLHVSRIRVKSLTLRLLMSYIYGAPIVDVSRSHTTTQHSR